MIILSMALALAIASDGPVDLHLICDGGGNATKQRTGSAYAWGSNGNSAVVSGTSTYDRGFADTVSLDINGATGRIRMPRTMLPKFHGGNEGWMDLADVEVTDREIRATAKVNALNHPKVVLDRIAGTISISGKSGDYAGRCRAYDPASEQRAF